VVFQKSMAKKAPSAAQAACPCQSGADYADCCSRYLNAGCVPQTAEQLMRSRYTGFVVCDEPYLLATWHADTRPSQVRLNDQQRWLGLSIRATQAGGADDAFGTVEFVARFKVAGKGVRLHEISRFEKIDERWYYLDGRHI
jgi:SEC-C motif-containing protein